MFTYLKVVSNMSLTYLQRAGSRTIFQLCDYMDEVTTRSRGNRFF